MPLLHLMTSNNPKMDWCNTLYFNYGHNVTCNFDDALTLFNDYFAVHRKRLIPQCKGHGFIKKHSWQSESVCTQSSECKKKIAEMKT